MAYSSATSNTLHPASWGTFAKMMRIATKSKNVPPIMPSVSSASDVGYWSCERTRARTKRRYSCMLSTRLSTLHLESADTETEERSRCTQESDGPGELHD